MQIEMHSALLTLNDVENNFALSTNASRTAQLDDAATVTQARSTDTLERLKLPELSTYATATSDG
jgi:hypothetical protein